MSKHPKINASGQYEGVIYEYRNKFTGKPYVGETDNETKRRQSWRRKSYLGYGGSKISKARKEYGVGDDAWDYSVLETIQADTHEELGKLLYQREEHWIREENAVDNGYNSSYGKGNLGMKFDPIRAMHCGDSMRGKHHTPETKAKISASGMGRIVSEETKAKISQGNKGKKRTADQITAMSEARKGQIPIAAKLGADRWRKENGGSYWKGKTMSKEARENMKKAQRERGTSCIAFFPDGHEAEFPTMKDAAIACGLNVGSVASAIKTEGKTRNGFKFKML